VNFRNARSRGDDLTIDLMPLIDVVFLLLIFFLITTSFAQNRDEKQIPINLPRGVTGKDVGEGKRVVLFVTKDGDVEVRGGGEQLQGKTLEDKLEALQKSNPDASILLKGDEHATHGRVVETLDSIKAAGFDKVNLVIRRPDSSK